MGSNMAIDSTQTTGSAQVADYILTPRAAAAPQLRGGPRKDELGTAATAEFWKEEKRLF